LLALELYPVALFDELLNLKLLQGLESTQLLVLSCLEVDDFLLLECGKKALFVLVEDFVLSY
jgi:hypothetical protein